jgi:hypothetical protein
MRLKIDQDARTFTIKADRISEWNFLWTLLKALEPTMPPQPPEEPGERKRRPGEKAKSAFRHATGRAH